MRALAILALLAGSAHADQLGLRDGIQGMPLRHAQRYAFTFGLLLARDLPLHLRGVLELDTVLLFPRSGGDGMHHRRAETVCA